MKLDRRLVPKPWGRTQLPPMFGDTDGERIGELWFTAPAELPLLGKYIFTSEALSVQNHPSDADARSRGLAQGKEECWFVLDAEPGATIALGWKREVSGEEIRNAASDGSIVDLLDWKRVAAGDFLYVPTGTVHAIGGGVSLFEFQQNSDVTYRIYDYGRDRELHLEEAIGVADRLPYRDAHARSVALDENAVLVDGPSFAFAHASDPSGAGLLAGRRRWVFPIDGSASSAGVKASAGEGLLLAADDQLELGGRALIGAEVSAPAAA